MSNDKFKVMYEVEDGYAGRSRPQYCTINASSLEEDMQDCDIVSHLDDLVLEHFTQNITHYISQTQIDKFKVWAKERLAERYGYVSELMDKDILTEEESLEMDVLADDILKYEEYFEYEGLSPFYQ